MSLESSPRSPSQANAEAPNMHSTKLAAAQKSQATTPIDDDRLDVSMSSQSQNKDAPSNDERLDLSVGAEFPPESSAHGTKSEISLTTGESAAKKTRTHVVSSAGDELTKLPGGSSVPSQHRQSDATAGSGTVYQSSNSAFTAVQPRQMVNDASAGSEESMASEHGSELWKIVVCMVYGMDFPQIIYVFGGDNSFSFFVTSFDLLAIAWTLSGRSATSAQTKHELERLAQVERSTLLVDPDARPRRALKLNTNSAELQAYCRNAPNLHVSTHVAQVRSLYTFDNHLANTLNLEKGDFEARALLELITYFCKQKKFQHIAKYHLGTDNLFRVVDLGRIRIALACRLGYTTSDMYPTKIMSNWGYIDQEGGLRSGHRFNLQKPVVDEMVKRKIGDYTLTFNEAFRRKLELLRTDKFEVNTGREITSSTQGGSNTATFTGVQPRNNPTNTRAMTSRLASEHASQAIGNERQSRHALPKMSTSAAVPESNIADFKRKSSADPEHHIAKQARTSSQNVPTSDESGSTTTSQQAPFGQQPLPIDDITRSESSVSPHRQGRSHATGDASGGSTGMRRNPSEDTEKAPNDQ